MLTQRDLPSLGELLVQHGLEDVEPVPLPNDGWSGSELLLLERGDERFVLKRDSLLRDWMARETRDEHLREGRFAAAGLDLPRQIWAPYLGVGRQDGEILLLMPDLSSYLIDWERPITKATLDRILECLAALHVGPWSAGVADLPWWCPLPERILLLSEPAGKRYRAAGLAPGERYVTGWNLFRRHASGPAIDLVDRLTSDPTPLLAALASLPATVLHGDFKLGNAGFVPDGRLAIIDWQMTMFAPIAVELGWFLAVNSLALPARPEEVFDAYRSAVVHVSSGEQAPIGDWQLQTDLATIVGLLLRGWRKGIDSENGIRLASGVAAGEDLRWWCRQALEAADRQL